jgi:flagellar hook-length control protein FliK
MPGGPHHVAAHSESESQSSTLATSKAPPLASSSPTTGQAGPAYMSGPIGTHTLSVATAGSNDSGHAGQISLAPAASEAYRGSNGSSNSPPANPTEYHGGDAFAALDSASSNPVWVHATPHRAEAGFRDPTLGWVGVRAQVQADGLHAVMVPASADAERALDSRMTGLGSYLAEQHIEVHTLAVGPPESSQGEGSQGNDIGGGQGGEQQTSSGERRSVPAEPNPDAPKSTRSDTTSAKLQVAQIGPRSEGTYISVIV